MNALERDTWPPSPASHWPAAAIGATLGPCAELASRVDGSVVQATGPVGGGVPLENALNLGFAVISSDAGHQAPTPFFGIDPQARLDYGYQAVGKLTPMAKNIIQAAYGKGPDRSYADQYDGILAGNPGYRQPLAALANVAGGKTYAALASMPGDPSTGFTLAERALVSKAVLDKCDALDGAADGMVRTAVLGECRRHGEVRALLPGAGHEPLFRRSCP